MDEFDYSDNDLERLSATELRGRCCVQHDRINVELECGWQVPQEAQTCGHQSGEELVEADIEGSAISS